MPADHYRYQCWMLVYPAPDVDGEWLAHNLSFDVMSQGSSAEHAIKMVEEATIMFLEHEMSAGRDPLQSGAEPSCWDTLRRVMQDGEKVRHVAEWNPRTSPSLVPILAGVVEVTASVEYTQNDAPAPGINDMLRATPWVFMGSEQQATCQ